ncbi:ImmA/IrrE family metallo-endopeptidase [Virgibacillus halophilus]|uniref:ImmA/IrrE family metallo-endopeptidase n=1 Tax=Tigheibacillus halophilus TaxID=361280 RepID=A0ABU5C603_9BACI|nr:ImmA/IrrE family metallo-endopeptidase [Virgibacillus halophilus]
MTVLLSYDQQNKKEWQEFGHELAHHLRHCGQQLNMHPLFRQLQEYQATYFAYHFCVPTFMLQQLIGISVKQIMNLFNVEYEFAVRRLEIYQNNKLGGLIYGQASAY